MFGVSLKCHSLLNDLFCVIVLELLDLVIKFLQHQQSITLLHFSHS